MIPLTAAEARRLFNLHTRVIRPRAFHEHWSDWRRRRQASARKSHYARRDQKSRDAIVVLAGTGFAAPGLPDGRQAGERARLAEVSA
jgi:hypothetical protein